MDLPHRLLPVLLPAVLLAATACGRGEPVEAGGLGELMGATQMRHAKLWFAGEAGNWPLAAYELDELREGFDDAVRLHPVHKGAEVGELLPALTGPAMDRLARAVAARDATAFPAAFDELTAACNACHEATGFGFDVVVRPTANPFTNQDFRPRPDAGRGGR